MSNLDLTNIDDVRAVLKKHSTYAKKVLGQNFLIDRVSLEHIVNAGDIQPDDQVLEVGPGLGVLTHEILLKTPNLTSLEMDPDMVRVVTGNMTHMHTPEELMHWNLIQTDALKYNIDEPKIGPKLKKGFKLIANIPYFITSPLLRHFLKDQFLKGMKEGKKNKDIITPSVVVFLIQKEVAEKIVSTKKESVIGLNIKVFGEPEIIAHVPASSFHPAPKVDSAILKITVFDTPKIDMTSIDIHDFFKLIEAGFNSPRKKLSNNLVPYFSRIKGLSSEETLELIKKANIDPGLRAEKLTLEDWVNLLQLLK